MLYTFGLALRRRRPTTVAAVLLALATLTGISTTAQKILQTPAKGGLTSSTSSFSPSNINYFEGKEANSALAVLDLLEATMQIYHNYQHHYGGNNKNDSTSFTMGVVLVTVSEDEFAVPDVFPRNRLRPVYSMQGTSRQLRVPDIVYKRAIQLLRDADELTITAVVRQERANTGSIVSFSLDSNRYLELESSGRKDEVRLHYVSKGSRRVHTEVFAYSLADDRWHAVAVTLSGTQARLFVDCRLVYTRTLAAGPADTSFTGSPDLYIGQRNIGTHSVFKGLLQDVRLIRGADGQRMQCPNLDTSCPTCGQFIALQKTMENLNKIVHQLSDKLEAAETRISELETCECRKPCVQFDERSNNTLMKVDGSVWQNECKTCTCVHGHVDCSPVRCPAVDCKYPIRVPGECCETCQKPCRTKGDIVFEHGDTINLEPCLNCICLNGIVKCDKIDAKTQCPILDCDASQQFSVPDQCCKFCPGVDYCARGGRDLCHPNATCINLKTTHKCACAVGYAGTGLQCDDVDECASVGGQNGHHCDANTTFCVNTPGSYSCQCKTGYLRLNSFECIDIDECSTEESPCHVHATCSNSIGSYSCKCADGYEGDGYTCRPVCRQMCLNGGICTRPDMCSCPIAFEGPACELDVDECATGVHGCQGPSSRCVNMAGWYYCACSPGYQSVIMYPTSDSMSAPDSSDLEVLEPTLSPLLGTMCQDIDECATNNHTCHPSATCVNTIGSYECKCLANNTNTSIVTSECKSSCLYKDDSNVITEVDNGSWVMHKECTNCTCTNGRLNCTHTECDCANNDHVQSNCCAHCNAQASCAHQELANVRFRSGQQWIYQCQTCECLMGQVDCWPMQCPPMLSTGVSGCTDSAGKTFADCCAPRCDSKTSGSLGTSTTAVVTVTDPCLQQQLDEHDDDSDSDNNSNNTLPPVVSRPCFYEGRTYQSGVRWDDPVDMCTSCDCKDGVLCCTYNLHRCNNSTVAGATIAADNTNHLSANRSRGASGENAGSGGSVSDRRPPPVTVKRSVRRRRKAAAAVDDADGGRAATADVAPVERDDGGGDDDDNSVNNKDWWWSKTRRRRRRRPDSGGAIGRRYQTSSVSSNSSDSNSGSGDEKRFNGHGYYNDVVGANSEKNEDNNSINNNNNNNNSINNDNDRIVVKTVVN